VIFEQSFDRRFQFFNIARETHIFARDETSCLSLVLTFHLVKFNLGAASVAKCRQKLPDAGNAAQLFLPLRTARDRLIIAQNGLPRHAAMRHYQGIEALPPRNISPFTAEKPDHLQHVVDFRRAERRIKSRHHASTLGDDLANVSIAFFFHRSAKIGWPHW
jgi:hypothetical protein